MYIDIPLGTAVYKLTTLERPKGRNEEELKEEFERQMRSHLGKQYDAIKESTACLESILYLMMSLFTSTRHPFTLCE